MLKPDPENTKTYVQQLSANLIRGMAWGEKEIDAHPAQATPSGDADLWGGLSRLRAFVRALYVDVGARPAAYGIPDPDDRRRMLISLSQDGARMVDRMKTVGHEITQETLKPLTAAERRTVVRLLRKLG